MTELGTDIVLLTPAEFRWLMTLPEYSYSDPTGVVAGKQWRAHRQGQHWLCRYIERDGEIWRTRRVVVEVPDGAVIEKVVPPDGSGAYWLACHRGAVVTFAGGLHVVASQLWDIERRSSYSIAATVASRGLRPSLAPMM